MYSLRPLFKKYGNNFIFDPFGIYTFENIEIGNDVYIGPNANLISGESYIKIGDKVMFGPNVSLIGGNHNISVVGKFMKDVKEKRPFDDLPIIIERDVWIGANSTILMGIVIGEGSVVGAGSIVTKDVPPFTIVAGNPARIIKERFSNEELINHKKALSKIFNIFFYIFLYLIHF